MFMFLTPSGTISAPSSPPPPNQGVSGGDGTTGALQGHTDGEHPGYLLGNNAWGARQTKREQSLELVTSPAHPNPAKRWVMRVEWRDGDVNIGGAGNKRAELNGMRKAGGGYQGESQDTIVYYACAMQYPSGFKFSNIYDRDTWWQVHAKSGQPSARFTVLSNGRINARTVARDIYGGATATKTGSTVLPTGGMIGAVWRVHWHHTRGSIRLWLLLPGATSFVEDLAIVNSGNHDPLHQSHKQGTYVNDAQKKPIDKWLTNIVRGTGFGAVAAESLGVTLI